MPESKLLRQIAKKGSDKNKIADRVIKNPKLLSEIFEGLKTDKARIKYGCAKIFPNLFFESTEARLAIIRMASHLRKLLSLSRRSIKKLILG